MTESGPPWSSEHPSWRLSRYLGIPPDVPVALLDCPVECWDPWLELEAHLLIGPGAGPLEQVVATLQESGLSPNQRLKAVDHWGTPLRLDRDAEPPWLLGVGPEMPWCGWAEKLPLHGRHLVVTRASHQAPALVRPLQQLGARVTHAPVLTFREPSNLEPINEALARSASYDWVVFTSPNGVDYFVRHLDRLELDLRSLGQARIASIGPGTAKRLSHYHLRADLIPKRYVAEGLLETFPEVDGQRFLLPRAQVARQVLPDELRQRGAEVDVVATYVTEPPETPATLPQEADLVLFTSSSSATNFSRLYGQGRLPCAAIGPVTGNTARELGFEVVVEACVHTIDGLVEAVTNHFQELFSLAP